MASFDSSDNETFFAPRKMNDHWVASITAAEIFIDDKRHANSTDIPTMLLSYLCLL